MELMPTNKHKKRLYQQYKITDVAHVLCLHSNAVLFQLTQFLAHKLRLLPCFSHVLLQDLYALVVFLQGGNMELIYMICCIRQAYL